MRRRAEINIGEEYGWLTVLSEAPKDSSGHLKYHVCCRCGAEFDVQTSVLLKRTSKCISCGQKHRKAIEKANIVGQTIKRKKDTRFAQLYGFQHTGYGWAGPRMRWCTAKLKDLPRERFLRKLREEYTVIEYIGIAADEEYRLKRPRNQTPNHRHPLVDWGMTEADCLQYCYDHGYDWNGLYEHFSRVSCWCCPLQSLSELRQLYYHHPDLWAKLKYWDSRTWRKFRADYSVDELEKRFDLENEYLIAGRSITDRAFYSALRQRLEEHNESP